MNCANCSHPELFHQSGPLYYYGEDQPRESVAWCLAWIVNETENYFCRCKGFVPEAQEVLAL